MFDLDQALRQLVAEEGSDLHLKVPARPMIRRHGHLMPLEGTDKLTPDVMEGLVVQMLDDEGKLAEFRSENEVDFSYSIPGLPRFRVNGLRQR